MSGEMVLIIDDDETTRNTLSMLLEFDGYSVRACESGACALELINKKSFEVFLIDYRISPMSGDQVTRMLRYFCPDAYIIGFSVEPREKSFLKAGADAFLDKCDLAQNLMPLIKNRHNVGMRVRKSFPGVRDL